MCSICLFKINKRSYSENENLKFILNKKNNKFLKKYIFKYIY